MSNIAGSLFGFVLFILACITINKIYKKKSGLIRALFFIGLYGFCFLLSFTILYLLQWPYDTSFINVDFGIGFIAEIISVITYFFYTKKNFKKKSEEYKSAKLNLILTIGIPLVVLIVVLIARFPTLNCKYPNEVVGQIDCCVPNYDYGIRLCKEEAEKLDNQMIYAVENDIITTKITESFLNKFSLLLPEGYLSVRNAKAGLYDYPIILMSSDEYDNLIQITVMYSESINYYGKLEESYPEIEMGLMAGSIYSKFGEPVFSENIEKGTEIVILKSVNKQEELEIFISNAFIKKDNKLIAIKYGASSKELYDYYHYEFEEMVNSVTFK